MSERAQLRGRRSSGIRWILLAACSVASGRQPSADVAFWNSFSEQNLLFRLTHFPEGRATNASRKTASCLCCPRTTEKSRQPKQPVLRGKWSPKYDISGGLANATFGARPLQNPAISGSALGAKLASSKKRRGMSVSSLCQKGPNFVAGVLPEFDGSCLQRAP